MFWDTNTQGVEPKSTYGGSWYLPVTCFLIHCFKGAPSSWLFFSKPHVMGKVFSGVFECRALVGPSGSRSLRRGGAVLFDTFGPERSFHGFLLEGPLYWPCRSGLLTMLSCRGDCCRGEPCLGTIDTLLVIE